MRLVRDAHRTTSLLANIANLASLRPAMPTRNVNLTEHLDRFVDARVSSGRFSNASEVVREGLRLLEQREREGPSQNRMAALRRERRHRFDGARRLHRSEHCQRNENLPWQDPQGSLRETAPRLNNGQARPLHPAHLRPRAPRSHRHLALEPSRIRRGRSSAL